MSAVTLTSRIRASVLAIMLMPRLDNDVVIGFNQSPDHVQLPGREAVVCRQFDRVKPEFASSLFASSLFAPDVYVHRLITIEAVEEEPVRSRDVFDSRHSPALPPFARNPYEIRILQQSNASFDPPNEAVEKVPFEKFDP
jgi:hypothetical protein